jgi:hypothetical protein
MRTLTLVRIAAAEIRISQSLRTSSGRPIRKVIRRSSFRYARSNRTTDTTPVACIRYAVATGFRDATTRIAAIKRRRIGETQITLFGLIRIVNKLVRIYAVRIN